MAEPNDSQLVEITPVWATGLEIATTSYWFHPTNDETLTSAYMTAAANFVGNSIKQNLQAFHPTQVQLVRVEGRQYLSNGNQNVITTTTPAYTGTNVANILPLQVALVVKLTTGYAGRSFRGRQYWPWFTEADSEAAAASQTVRDAVYACETWLYQA